jgi:hypothetical protein
MSPAGDADVPAPLAMFLAGDPTAEQDLVSDAILDLRPGVLIVVAGA